MKQRKPVSLCVIASRKQDSSSSSISLSRALTRALSSSASASHLRRIKWRVVPRASATLDRLPSCLAMSSSIISLVIGMPGLGRLALSPSWPLGFLTIGYLSLGLFSMPTYWLLWLVRHCIAPPPYSRLIIHNQYLTVYFVSSI